MSAVGGAEGIGVGVRAQQANMDPSLLVRRPKSVWWVWMVVIAGGCANVSLPTGAGSLVSADGGANNPGSGSLPAAPPVVPDNVADSDADGVPDVVEEAAGTDPADSASTPLSRGDFYFLVPYQRPPAPERDSLVFEPVLRRADVFFMIDTSVSMQSIIDEISRTLSTVIIPGISADIPDLQVGLGQFDICPTALPTGRGDACQGIRREVPSTSDMSAVERGLGALTADCAPVHEPYAQAAWLFATGDTMSYGPAAVHAACPAGTSGLGCTRDDALPILVVIGDEPFAESYLADGSTCSRGCDTCADGPRPDAVGAALADSGAKVIVYGNTALSSEWATVAAYSGSVDASGQALLFPTGGTTGWGGGRRGADSGDVAVVGEEIAEAIKRLAQQVPLDLAGHAQDLDDDGVDATVFVARLEANAIGGVRDRRDAGRVCASGLPTRDDDGDGHPDVFVGTPAGTPICVDVVVAENRTVPATDTAQVYAARIQVMAEGRTVMDERTAYFLVPPISDAEPSTVY